MFPCLLGPVTIMVVPCCFRTLEVLKMMGQVFCRMSLHLDLSDAFLVIRLGRGSAAEVACPSHGIGSAGGVMMTWIITSDVSFCHLVKVISLRSFHCIATFFFSFHILFFGHKLLSPKLREGKIKLCLPEGVIYNM